MKDLKQALLTFPALQPINYKFSASVILSIDTSQIAVGFILSQCDLQWLKELLKCLHVFERILWCGMMT
jgi:hypothetical protein